MDKLVVFILEVGYKITPVRQISFITLNTLHIWGNGNVIKTIPEGLEYKRVK